MRVPSDAAKEALAKIFCRYGDAGFEWDLAGNSYGNNAVSRARILADAERALLSAYAIDFPVERLSYPEIRA